MTRADEGQPAPRISVVVSADGLRGRRRGKQVFVRDRVLELIGSLGVGSPIPPERELAAQLRVARMTVRHALDGLVSEGYLIRRQGSGTFVGRSRLPELRAMVSFSEDMRARGLVPASRTLSVKSIMAGAALGKRLNLSPSSSVLQIVRLKLADNKPMAIETVHIPQSLMPGMTADALGESSIEDILERDFGTAVDGATETIGATVTTETESALLGIPLHSPAFLVEHLGMTAAGVVVEFGRWLYRGDRYQLTAELKRSGLHGRTDRNGGTPRSTSEELTASIVAPRFGAGSTHGVRLTALTWVG